MIKVFHIITGLGVGGAEVMLSKLVRNKADDQIVYTVIALGPRQVIGEELAQFCRVVFLDLKNDFVRGLRRLYSMVNEDAPAVVQTWLYHADLVGGVVGRLAGSRKVIWNIRQANLGWRYNKKATLAVAMLCAALSRWIPAVIIANSVAAKEAHVGIGYSARKFMIAPNCFDPAEFRTDAEARQMQRRTWHVGEGKLVIGTVARFDRQKGLHDFVDMAARLLRSGLPVTFVMVGTGNVAENPVLRDWLDAHGILCHFVLLGARRDVAAVLNGLDIFVLPSHGESFPNALCEAMLCQLPCVATDVGDIREILGGAGTVCPPRSPESLAHGVADYISQGPALRAAKGEQAREVVRRRFSVDAVVEQYESLYRRSASAGFR